MSKEANWRAWWQAMSELKEITDVLQNTPIGNAERETLLTRRLELLDIMDEAVPPADTNKNNNS